MNKIIFKITAFVLLFVIAFSFTACQNNTGTPVEPGTNIPIIPRPEPTPERFAGTAVRFEAEDFSSGVENCPWASGGKFVGGFDSAKGARINFKIESSEETEVKLVFCVANTANYTIFFESWSNFLKVNNVKYNFAPDVILHDRNIPKGETYADQYPAYASTAPYLMFDTVEVIIELNAGENIITFTGGSVTFNFDYIEIIPENDSIQIKAK